MMSLLHWVLAPPSSHRLVTFPKAWGQPPRPIPGFQNAKFSVLYSDVGPNFYARAGPTPDGTGWVVRDPISTIWQLKEIKTASTTPIWLSEKEVYYHLERESARMKDELPKKSYTFLPNEGVCGFLIKRTVRFPSADKPEWPSPIWGVALEDSFATWTFDMAIPVPALVITYFHSSEEEFPELLAHIGAFAKTFGNIQVIEGWNVPEEFRGGAVTKTRDDHLSAVIWYGDETDRGEYRWAWNEKWVLILRTSGLMLTKVFQGSPGASDVFAAALKLQSANCSGAYSTTNHKRTRSVIFREASSLV